MTSSNQPETSSLPAPATVPAEVRESQAAVPSLIQTATMEFHASLHLLADRARFVTGAAGAAIAIDEDGDFVYCASSGKSVPGCGAAADMGKPNLSACIETRRVARSSNLITIPVIRQKKVAGFFELADIHGSVRGNTRNDDNDNNADEIEAVSRLAEMVNTAIDHLEAAEHAESGVHEIGMHEIKPEAGPVLGKPILLSLPDGATKSIPSTMTSSSPAPIASVRICRSCGFPVSLGRVFCVECEEHPERITVNPGEGLFQMEAQESWISAHGYTIASLLITALVAAIIFWLR
ncbi:MAG TPA: hypothetical protein VIL63_09930 [Terriglobales bacterium]